MIRCAPEGVNLTYRAVDNVTGGTSSRQNSVSLPPAKRRSMASPRPASTARAQQPPRTVCACATCLRTGRVVRGGGDERNRIDYTRPAVVGTPRRTLPRHPVRVNYLEEKALDSPRTRTTPAANPPAVVTADVAPDAAGPEFGRARDGRRDAPTRKATDSGCAAGFCSGPARRSHQLRSLS